MRTLGEISYDNRISVQTLYKRILARGIPTGYKNGVRAVDEKQIPDLLSEGQKGRRLKEVPAEVSLDKTE